MNFSTNFSNETELKRAQDQLYELSKKNTRFHSLYEMAFNETTIITAIHKIKANRGANTPGVDGHDIRRYLQMDKNNVIKLITKAARNYKSKPARRVYIEKADGSQRPLGIPTVVDRIIQECIRTILEPIVEAKFYDHSYGFRPYRSSKHAVRQVNHFINTTKSYYAIEGDIKGYFDNINHRFLIKKLWRLGIRDKRIIKIIQIMLKAGYMEYDFKFTTEKGTPQGGIISPLLANVYLNDFDWMVARRFYKAKPTGISKEPRKQRERLVRQGRNKCYLVRYADDWIILTQTYQEARRYLEYLRKYFRIKLKLELSKEKTVITDLREKPALFLGFDIYAETPLRSNSGNIVGKNKPNHRKVSGQISKVCKEIRKMRKVLKEEFWIEQIIKVNQMLEGYAEYWKVGICADTFDRIDYNVNNSLFRTFKKLFPSGYMRHKVKMCELGNRPSRHHKYQAKTFAIKKEGFWVGVTKASYTPSEWLEKPFNQRTTPYTIVGREIYYKQRKKLLRLDRPHIMTLQDFYLCKGTKSKYNFEYFMNREYAYNRDRGKCRCCNVGLDFMKENAHCHHIEPYLPMDLINRVANLAWVCKECHTSIHCENYVLSYNAKTIKKIDKFRSKLLQK
ncbi:MULTISPECIES: group II intron reverse transcriptase/maturase [Bacillus]|uniref:group II intron reverse transcriptase/maturase n=1 Tax=Bacillus TaxID=1386 RepID=UPI0001A13693|nr:group II intron reverse transcriptase/maturase [Bacillus pseudomycoides]EEM17194.1 D-alanine--D-alanine ligase A (D-alanylalanine synthetaseA) [Bacillus pseudomycoides DSM 12442]MED1599213.1 group II intron reverse transcriptase/maturase [Bacillus pseudomycoides]MED4710502.1 group II intron reverse transcriptase/maturase [Bacillus pseudomycoides]OOR49684.1 group II intron reverse transcriptase/maturase [Bacillus pseudomycoides]PDY14633.1 group II intron reverse transcriptase/maturase [Bacil